MIYNKTYKSVETFRRDWEEALFRIPFYNIIISAFYRDPVIHLTIVLPRKEEFYDIKIKGVNKNSAKTFNKYFLREATSAFEECLVKGFFD